MLKLIISEAFSEWKKKYPKGFERFEKYLKNKNYDIIDNGYDCLFIVLSFSCKCGNIFTRQLEFDLAAALTESFFTKIGYVYSKTFFKETRVNGFDKMEYCKIEIHSKENYRSFDYSGLVRDEEVSALTILRAAQFYEEENFTKKKVI